MFEAHLTDGRMFKQIVDAVKDLVNDMNIDCGPDGVSIQSMDSAHVALVAVQLSSGAFDHYRCDRNNSLGINTANMAKILKLMNNDDTLLLKADDGGDALTMMFEGTKNGSVADFEFKLSDIENEQLGIPETQYQCTIKMPAREFERIIRDLQVLGDTCTISSGKEGVRFSVSGNLGTGNILVRANPSPDKDKDQVMIEGDDPVELNFALRYLNFFTKATSLSESVIISLSPEVPIVVEYPIEEHGHIKYFLAPKIEED